MPLGVKQGKPIIFEEPLPNAKIINVPQIEQEQSNWCWAACTEMVLRYYNVITRQCELANELFGRSECCETPSSPDCNKPCEIENVKKFYLSKHIHSKFVEKPVSFDKLQLEINADRPVEVVFFQINKEMGHLVIINGWYVTATEKFVYINDPKDSNDASRIVAYSELLDAYGEGKWLYTWIEIQR